MVADRIAEIVGLVGADHSVRMLYSRLTCQAHDINYMKLSAAGRMKRDRRTYNIWACMKQRCKNPKNPNFWRYGGRGITLHPAWNLYENFLADMGVCPPNLTIERRDNDGGYNPSNCYWATRAAQMRNRTNFVNAKIKKSDISTIRKLAQQGHTQASIAKRYGVSSQAISLIVNKKSWRYA